MGSVRQIARAVGVSAATVSRVINSDPRVAAGVRNRVLDAANRLRYVAAVGRRPSTNIAFVYTSQPSIGSPYDTALLQGLSDAMAQPGLDLVILNAARARLPHESYSQMFMRRGVRGAVLRAASDSHDVVEEIVREGFPAVVVGERFASPRVSFVHAESRPASRAAVEHLIDLGHRRIAVCVNGVPDSDHADRLAGYRDALQSAGIQFDERLVFQAWAQRDGGAQVIRKIASIARPPTAVYITDPMVAVGALQEARRTGLRVPEELSIVGFDDGEVRFMSWPLMTAVCQDATAVGRAAFDVLRELMALPGHARSPATVTAGSQHSAPRRLLQTWFEVHGTTAPPPPRHSSAAATAATAAVRTVGKPLASRRRSAATD
jgi:DNA-binding LacI/PurR family transcriptional regulator